MEVILLLTDADVTLGGGDGGEARVSTDEISALRAIVEGTAANTGQQFFQSLVRHLAAAIDVGYAFVAEFAGPDRARTLAYWKQGRVVDNVEWDLRGTPCEDVVRGSLCHHPAGVSRKFPDDRPMVEMGIESYLGVPLRDLDGRTLGHLAVFDERPMPAEPRRLFIFRIFAARAAAELLRIRADQLLKESEERYRDLYEEAPSAYVSLSIDGRLTSANRRAAELLGVPAERLLGTPLLDLFAESPAGRPRAVELLSRFAEGEEIAGAELEMCRADGGPLWINLWLKPLRGNDGTILSGRAIWVDVTDRVLGELERARLQQQNLYLQEEIKADHNFEEIVGRSPSLLTILGNVRQVAPTDASVLLTGETGTGKELFARAIHSNSARRDKPLIKVNCAALPTGLVESELFGHERGAFSGAIAKRIGRFELANGGTLFLDEVGEIPLEVQAKLLRVLQEREFERVGGNVPIAVDVRIIAATNRDLLKSVREGTFREDLYYRLSVFPIHLPALRERREDIPLLVRFLVNKFSARTGKKIEGLTGRALETLTAYAWPGNVRELENVLERAVILAPGPMLDIDPASLSASAPTTANLRQASLETVERNHILAVLEQTKGTIDGPHGAARILDLHPNTLRSRLKKLGIARPGHDPS